MAREPGLFVGSPGSERLGSRMGQVGRAWNTRQELWQIPGQWGTQETATLERAGCVWHGDIRGQGSRRRLLGGRVAWPYRGRCQGTRVVWTGGDSTVDGGHSQPVQPSENSLRVTGGEGQGQISVRRDQSGE